ncbi:MAG: carboxylesterase [Rhodoferax sp.]|nr:carboxylesterase [Rhodoferax sp.]
MNNCLPCIETTSGPVPTASVIWLHGLGADGNDFAAIVPELDLGGCPAIRFVFPHASSIPVTLNGGHVMPAWYDILGTELQRREDEAGIRRSALAIEALIEREIGRGIASERIVLAGFSQGCAMVLHTGLRYPRRLAGIVALSGYLPLAHSVAAECSDVNRSLPIFMAHGINDPMIILARAEASRNALTTIGYTVQWHTYPMPHSVHPAEITEIGHFLRVVLSTPGGATAA